MDEAAGGARRALTENRCILLSSEVQLHFDAACYSSERTGKGMVRLSILRSLLQGSWTSSAAHGERAAATLLHLVFLYFRVVGACLRKDLNLNNDRLLVLH